ncbi:MAG: hypothetical protein WBM98_06495, partial [Maribacter sp.]|uniref:hypothetical protein n=1 Tax=Maribacter sp. TaxID=1897614 RepID=UPI003C779F13
MSKRNKEKGALSEAFFLFPKRKTASETPRRCVPHLLFSELSNTMLRIRDPSMGLYASLMFIWVDFM